MKKIYLPPFFILLHSLLIIYNLKGKWKSPTNFRSSRTINMEKKIKWVAMKFQFLQINLLLACISYSSSISTAQGTKVISHNDVNPEESSLKTYIVHIDEIPNEVASAEPRDIHSWYHSFLPLTTTSSSHQNSRMVHTYRHVVSGFAARLTAEEAKAMEIKDGIVSVVAEKILPLHTTRSPSFIGLSQGVGLWNISNYGQGVIIGVLDTGIEPYHPSFNDKGMPVPPAKWKGKCEFSLKSTCNNKLIGARSFVNHGSSAKSQTSGGNLPPFDDEGHGTHTSSIAAGSFVEGANVFGLANGTAVGIAPLAHLAIYKVCSSAVCPQSSILAAIDAAIEDGVDVISMSLGGSPMKSFSNDVLAIASFRAMQHGIFVSCSAGNLGPFNSTVSNPSPWVITVGASNIDRSIRATAMLGNLVEFGGESVFQPSNFNSTLLPLVYPNKKGTGSPAVCDPMTLKQVDVKGKVVFCQGGGGADGVSRGEEVKRAGGAAMIVMNEELDGNSILATPHVLPATQVSYSDGLKIKAYMNSTSEPMATIVFKGTELGNSSAPMVLSLSSRGPGLASPGILKPDILGPGVNILAAWPFPLNKTASFYLNTGTSMACPHISSVAALLKSSQPDWSPAAIKSAIMTTADVTNLEGLPILDYTSLPANLFATGAGHVNPSKANDPGLVYDIQPDDYIPYLCGLKYSDKEIEKITRRQAKCSKVQSIAEAELNYPSFSIVFGRSPQTFTRKVTNVGPAGNSSYSVEVVPPKGVSVRVMPEIIIFGEVKQTISYSVTFSTENEGESVGEPNSQGFLKWVSSEHSVRSPISVQFK